MFAYRVICRQSPEHIDVKDFKLLKYSQVAELVDAREGNDNNPQREVVPEGRYYKYRFESCPDYEMFGHYTEVM